MKNLKYIALLLPLLNRIRGGLPILFGKELSTFWGKLAISLILAGVADSIDASNFMTVVTFASSFVGLSLAHGSWFPSATDPDLDAFAPLARFLLKHFKRRTVNVIQMALTGLIVTLGLSVTLAMEGHYILAGVAILGGLSKTIAYELAEIIPVGKKIKGAHQGIELAEWIYGAFLAIMVLIIL